MRRLWSLLMAMICIVMLTGCQKYQAEDMIGKTSEQILEQYGEFDCIGKPADADGLYRNTCCGYTIKEPRVGLLGTDPEVLLFIHFDENGIAFECEEGYRPGG